METEKDVSYQRWLHERGFCPRCKQKDEYTKRGYWLCAECARKVSDLSKSYYQAHREELLAKQKEKREEWKRNGICINCGKRPAEDGKASCEVCLQKKRERRNGVRAREKWR